VLATERAHALLLAKIAMKWHTASARYGVLIVR